jgi:hypothetical protein
MKLHPESNNVRIILFLIADDGSSGLDEGNVVTAQKNATERLGLKARQTLESTRK